MKTFSTFKQLSRLLPLSIFTAIISVIATCSLSAATITSFPPSDFWPVDHTTQEYTVIGGTQYNPTGIIGYYHKRGNEYQLTDTVINTTVAIWNKNKIDLNQNWQFDLKLFFDTGASRVNTGTPVGDAYRRVSEGMCFVLHNIDTLQNLIGRTTYDIGYGGIYPSFAVEFDTEHNGAGFEGGEENGKSHHISYIRGSMKALPNTYQPMQNNWSNVGIGQWFDVRFVWRKGYDENNVPYYELLTYMEEKDSLSTIPGPLLLRNSMRFNSLSEVVAGLEVDSNCQALVTWGVTAATCNNANHHMVDFVKLETTEVLSFPAITTVIGRTCWPNGPRMASSDFNSNSIPFHYTYRDTILQPIDIADCYGVVSSQTPPPNDTIEYTISCEDSVSYCNYFLEINDIPDSAECEYYINDSLAYSIIYHSDGHPSVISLFPFNFQDISSDLHAKVKIIINGVEYNFKIFMEDDTMDLAAHLAQLPNIQLDADMRSGTLTLDSNTLTQSIGLPDFFGCSYRIGRPLSYASAFTTRPTIDSNNVLTFELNPDVCSAELYMFLQCECDGMFVLTVKNSDCIENTCALVTIAVPPKKRDTVSGVGKYGSSTNQPVYSPWSANKTEYTVTSTTGNSNSISYVTVYEIIAQGKTGWIKTKDVTPLNDTSYGVSISFKTPICGETVTKSNYEICAHLMDGTTCCDTFSFYLHCKPPLDWISISSWILPGTISYKLLDEALFNSPIVPPLYVKVFDSFGTQLVSTLHSSVPTNLAGLVFYQHLPIGTYNIVFQWGDYVKTIQVISTGSDR